MPELPKIPQHVMHRVRFLDLNEILQTTCGSRAGKWAKRPIKNRITARIKNITQPRGVDLQNLSSVSTSTEKPCLNVKSLDVRFLNARSIRNKTDALQDYVVEHDIDILTIGETWLGRPDDLKTIGDLKPSGYEFEHVPRPPGSEGYGGVGILYKSGISVKVVPNIQATSFESMEALVTVASSTVRLIVVYRPPPSEKNKLSKADFFDEFAQYLQDHAVTPGYLLLLGDLNFHMDIPTDVDQQRLSDMLESMNLKQWVNEPTHNSGHTLDLLVTRSSESIVAAVNVTDLNLFADHAIIGSKLAVRKPPPTSRTVVY
jgi:exonuclease III